MSHKQFNQKSNIDEQNLNVLEQRPKFGFVKSIQSIDNFSGDGFGNVVDISGKGALHYLQVEVDNNNWWVAVKLDEPSSYHNIDIEDSYLDNSEFYKRITYNADGKCILEIIPKTPLSFEDRLEVEVTNNNSSTSIQVINRGFISVL